MFEGNVSESGEVLEKVVQRNPGCIQVQDGWGPEQSDLEVSNPGYGKEAGTR